MSLRECIERRLLRAAELATNPDAQLIELELCRRSVEHFFDNWVWTYNPQNVGTDVPTYLPMQLFEKQRAMLRWFDDRLAMREDGLLEKAREIGFTWTAGGYAIHKWRWVPGFKTSFGSRKQDLVDKIGDPDSIFEKLRILLRLLPAWMLPPGYSSVLHDNHLRLTNPDTGNVIVGEAGDEMGRGGRSSLYFLDEFAFVERADRVDAATSANCNTRIFGSSANGVGNSFHRKRFDGKLLPRQIFRIEIKDDPRKTPEWIAAKKRSLEEHIWASEYEIDYSASVEGIAIPGKYVEASYELRALLAQAQELTHEQVKETESGPGPHWNAALVARKRLATLRGKLLEPDPDGIVGLDVGGGGKARSVAVARFGPVVLAPLSWGDPDTVETAHRGLDYAEAQQPQRSTKGGGTMTCRTALVNYDSPGVGAGCLGVMERGRRGMVCEGVNTGTKPTDRVWPDNKTSEEKFTNLKAELWFLCRERFKNTFELVQWLKGEDGGQEHVLSDCLLMPDKAESSDVSTMVGQLSSVKWKRTETGKYIMESKDQLKARGIASPDHADALVLTFKEDSTVADWRAAFGRGRGGRAR